VHSEQFRSSEVLRRLLTFLSEKAIAGEADNLKEYVVAIEGLGKSSTYDPQHNSAVRMGRLRQRLAEYYRAEGKSDPTFVDLPKGRFRLTFEPRSNSSTSSQESSPVSTLPLPAQQIFDSAASKTSRPSLLRLVAGFVAVVLLLGLGYLLGRTVTHQQTSLTAEVRTWILCGPRSSVATCR